MYFHCKQFPSKLSLQKMEVVTTHKVSTQSVKHTCFSHCQNFDRTSFHYDTLLTAQLFFAFIISNFSSHCTNPQCTIARFTKLSLSTDMEVADVTQWYFIIARISLSPSWWLTACHLWCSDSTEPSTSCYYTACPKSAGTKRNHSGSSQLLMA